MRIFKHKRFHQWAKAEKLPDKQIKQAISEMNEGLFDVNLGSNLYKKRVSRTGQGKSGGYRTLIIFKKAEIAFFVYGFAKNEKENIGSREKETFKKLSKHFLGLTEDEISILIQNGDLIEVKYHE